MSSEGIEAILACLYFSKGQNRLTRLLRRVAVLVMVTSVMFWRRSVARWMLVITRSCSVVLAAAMMFAVVPLKDWLSKAAAAKILRAQEPVNFSPSQPPEEVEGDRGEGHNYGSQSEHNQYDRYSTIVIKYNGLQEA